MKFNKIMLIIPALLAVPSLSGCEKNEEKSIAAYYSSIKEDDYGGVLVEKLHKLMWDTHVYFTKYGKFTSYTKNTNDYESIDLNPATGKNQYIYSGKEYKTSSSYTREHVWPCANSSGLWEHSGTDISDPTGGGADLYHVRPANTSTNTLRGNSKFIDFDDFEGLEYMSVSYESGGKKVKFAGANETGTGKYEYANWFEVDDTMKGDVARIIAYVWLHYTTNAVTPTKYLKKTAYLSLMNVIGYTTESECKQKLVEWNELDPVSEVEKHRNREVQKIQGNRNPFVDHPEYMAPCFEIDDL